MSAAVLVHGFVYWMSKRPRQKINLSDRVDEATQCKKCAAFLARTTCGKTATHNVLDSVDEFHHNGHNEYVTPRPVKRKAVAAPPSSANEDTHKFQSIFVKVVEEYLPPEDKLNPIQKVVVNEDVTMTVFERAGCSRRCFRPTKIYGEEQARPNISALVEGIVSLIGGDEEVCIACEGPVRYIIKTTDECGREVSIVVSPPGEEATAEHELLSRGLSHDERKGKTWKKDFLISSLVKIIDALNITKAVWIPLVHVETKGDTASKADLFQASTNAWKLQLKRLQNRETIGRLYIEVWGTVCWVYGIQDIFGYITVDNGVITSESFALYQRTVENYRHMWGKAFPEESLSKCPQTLDEMQALYNETAQEYQEKWKQSLPSMNTVEDFPVGVVYFSPEIQNFPSGKVSVDLNHAARFIQGHVRILASNWMIPKDSRHYAEANERLLRNHRKFIEQGRREAEKMLDLKRPTTELPAQVIYKSWEQASVSGKDIVSATGEASASGTTGGDILKSQADPPSQGDVFKNPPSRAVVGTWTNEEVKELIRATCGRHGADSVLLEAVDASEIDGFLLLRMNSTDLDLWFTEIGLQRVAPRIRLKSWLGSLR